VENGRNRNVVVIGGSAGALEPLKEIVSKLPPDLPAAVLVALHIGPNSPSLLVPILNRSGGLVAVSPKDGDPPRPGYIYVAMPDHHLEVTPEGLVNNHGPRVNGVRPAIDVLFKSAATTFGPHVIGVILSGGLDDGSAGVASIRIAGGVTIVQDPEDAVVSSMPANAIQRSAPDHVAPAREIAGLIAKAVSEPAHNNQTKLKGGITMSGAVGADDQDGLVTGLTCPDCHGSIWMAGSPDEVTFRCRVGHAYSPEAFFELQSENVESALWAGVRSLEEQAALAQAMARRAERQSDEAARERFEKRRRLAASNAEVLRRLLTVRD
jgi:two-component system chemotaxis response regulator CheB